MKLTKIAIIGAGNVGSTIAYSCLMQNIAAQIMLVDINEEFCEGQVIDLRDTLAFSKSSVIQQATHKEAGSADIIIISAGAKQKPNQKRTELITTNKKIIKEIFHALYPIKEGSIIIMVTNPLDVLTLYAQQIAHHSRNLIFGSGTYLDTQRFRGYISQKAGVAPESIHAYMLGEHGDSEFAAWSATYIAGNPIKFFKEFTEDVCNSIEEETRNKAYKIIECKGSTYFGIGACIATICKAIIFDEKEIFPLSHYHKKDNICYSMPAIIGANGIQKMFDIPLNEDETKKLNRSIEKIKNDTLALKA